jgi:hypothetical protein
MSPSPTDRLERTSAAVPAARLVIQKRCVDGSLIGGYEDRVVTGLTCGSEADQSPEVVLGSTVVARVSTVVAVDAAAVSDPIDPVV